MGSPTGAAGGERGKECSRGIAHRCRRGREGERVQPWDRPQALLGEGGGGLQLWDRPLTPQERGKGGAQPWDRPLALPGEGGG